MLEIGFVSSLLTSIKDFFSSGSIDSSADSEAAGGVAGVCATALGKLQSSNTVTMGTKCVNCFAVDR